jgi:hypothetical protein
MTRDRTCPVIMLSYAHSGAQQVQDILAAGSGLACTASTGILPLTAAAADTWRRIDGHAGPGLSQLAISAIRALVSTQITIILAGAGAARWCELATAAASTAEDFLRIFPQAAFVCVHRRCLDVIRTGVQASPWGLAGQGLTSSLLRYPGNSVAALAAYWANATADLLAFEQAHPGASYRVRYEDILAEPDQALDPVRAGLGLGHATLPPGMVASAQTAAAPGVTVPAEMIPLPLRQKVQHLEAGLGYRSP